jgi:hypothetical protein
MRTATGPIGRITIPMILVAAGASGFFTLIQSGERPDLRPLATVSAVSASAISGTLSVQS